MQQIPLNKGFVALVDDDVYTLVIPKRWHVVKVHGNRYARTNVRLPDGRKTLIDMHRFIMNAKRGQRVDHRDGNGLHNTSANLRFCTHAQNMRNQRTRTRAKTSRFRGVSWNSKREAWAAQIKAERHYFLGFFDNEELAAHAYDRAAIKHHREFASTNFPREQYA
jgi:hypothetical protein